jgi:predicted metalloprotease with PDZ domain
LPYDFSKENHARTGFVYEGFTTYYGDLLLLSSGVFTNEQYFETLEERLDKHFHNYGRFNLSVAASSYDTWLDGYVPGTPYRKTSIYDEGNLIAFMLDVQIFKYSKHTKGLKDVCQVLYNQFGKLNKGYSDLDIISLCESMAGTSFTSFFEKYVFGTEDYEAPLTECFNYLSIEFTKQSSLQISEDLFGFKTLDFGLNRKISLIVPYSPAWKAGLSIGDEIIAVNGYTLKNDFNDWMNYFKHSDIELTVSSAQRLKTVSLSKNPKGLTYFSNYKLRNAGNNDVFKAWLTINS